MEKEIYEECKFKVIFFDNDDVLTSSYEEGDFDTPLT